VSERAGRAAEVIPDVLAREMIYGVDVRRVYKRAFFMCSLSLQLWPARPHNDIILSPSDDVCARALSKRKEIVVGQPTTHTTTPIIKFAG
jgi:hypothetical protein